MKKATYITLKHNQNLSLFNIHIQPHKYKTILLKILLSIIKFIFIFQIKYIYYYSFLIFIIKIIQKNKPKIIITDPTTKTNQINRNYDFTNHLSPENTSNLTTTSD